jgi:hypothetical protein
MLIITILTNVDTNFPLPHLPTLHQHQERDQCLHQCLLHSRLHQHLLTTLATSFDKGERPCSAALHMGRKSLDVLERRV